MSSVGQVWALEGPSIHVIRAPTIQCSSQLHTSTCLYFVPCRPCHLRGRFCPSALELQALGRERESRLQLAEYQLRLAQEDLREMQRRLADKVREGLCAKGWGRPE